MNLRAATARRASALARVVAFVGLALICVGCERDAALVAREREEHARVEAELRRALEVSRARVGELEAALDGLRVHPADACAEHERELQTLRDELAAASERRLAREREWLAYTSALTDVRLPRAVELPIFVAQVPGSEGGAEVLEPQADPADAQRSRELARALRTLLAIEGVRGLDLLEVGALGEGWLGPVVFRVLDEKGRLAGSLSAARLRLEGSRTARTLTLVLEDGYEMRAGVRVPFAPEARLAEPASQGGVRRIELPDTDPMPWVAELRELFGAQALEPPPDDGRWNATYVRGALNRLLALDTSTGSWQVRALAGVQGVELRGVQLDFLGREGHVEKRVFADGLTIALAERGVVLELRDGAQVRGDDKIPFLDGKLRIFLPRAQHAQWRARPLPGLSEPDGSPAAAQSDGERRSG